MLLQGQSYLQRAWEVLGLQRELMEQEVGMGWLPKTMGKKNSLYRYSSQDVTLLNRKYF